MEYVLDSKYHYYCFIDITVQEYIVGAGPPELTVAMHREVMWIEEEDNPDIFDQNWNILETETAKMLIEEYSEHAQIRTSEAYEGKEMILFLANTLSIAVESWETLSYGLYIWFVQKTDDGIRAVAQEIDYAQTDEQRAELNRPLDEIIQDIKRAHQNKIVLTEGRIGTAPTLPMMVVDANKLRDYYKTIGAVYNTGEADTKLPPPVPGENDPTAPTIPTNDGTTETTTPTPGEEPTTA